jgi:prepilin-type N-terminal cleavage/methylation domain-containing protein
MRARIHSGDRRGARRAAGFTLVELMIAVAVLSIVIVAVMQSFVVQNKAYTVTDQVVEAQQNLRAVAWLFERDARMAGFMVPEAAALCALDRDDQPDVVWFTDSDAIDPDNQERNALGVDVAVASYSGTGSQDLDVSGVVLDGAAFYDTDDDGAADADFVAGNGAILVDLDDPARGSACGIVEDVAGGTVSVDFLTSITPSPGARLILVPAHVYQVDETGDTPVLRRNGRLLAGGIEDLQLAFFFDMNRNGTIDGPDQADGEFPGGGEGAAPAYESDAWDNRDLREIHISLVVRTRAPDQEHPSGQFQTTENRVAPGGTDGFRRRVHSSTVRLRNVGFRGSAI